MFYHYEVFDICETKSLLEYIVAAVTLDHIATMAFDTTVAFVIPLVVLLM
jgi:hypothetical protein